ncbi:glycoside hydrolase [Caulobacter sp. Root1455]|uniref:glycoside hydrolase family 16 protein n=1 Tax=Caulobacter sp. Root1455 TaxID=1736465 RepID=UPI0006F34A07|nr:glycoside hydrolase family 16 protein [Caulobacter sp. Root1455]KQY92624.1 glycoside hydrolase [Caulobacter sp. Root1455]
MLKRIIASLLLLASSSALADPKGEANYSVDLPNSRPADARLVWSDEFDLPVVDARKWAFDTSRNKLGWWNNELQYYAAGRRENVRVADGRLVIEARHDDLADPKPADWGGQRYSSAKLMTQGLADWTYGFFEVRAKLACGRGTWPAIWMMPADPTAPWPQGGEIDIMEHVGWDQGTVHGTLHTGKYNHAMHTARGGASKLPDVCGAFHRYQLDWNKDRILIGVDDRAYVRIDNDQPGDVGAWPFDKPQYLILNLAVGGWGGRQGVDDAAFPARFEVDYVRVYQRGR